MENTVGGRFPAELKAEMPEFPEDKNERQTLTVCTVSHRMVTEISGFYTEVFLPQRCSGSIFPLTLSPIICLFKYLQPQCIPLFSHSYASFKVVSIYTAGEKLRQEKIARLEEANQATYPLLQNDWCYCRQGDSSRTQTHACPSGMIPLRDHRRKERSPWWLPLGNLKAQCKETLGK